MLTRRWTLQRLWASGGVADAAGAMQAMGLFRGGQGCRLAGYGQQLRQRQIGRRPRRARHDGPRPAPG